jgi:hypothetical protein
MNHSGGETQHPTITPTIIRIAEKFDRLSLAGKAEVLSFILSFQNGVGQQFDEVLLLLSKSA